MANFSSFLSYRSFLHFPLPRKKEKRQNLANIALRIAFDIKLFDTLAERNSKPKTCAELAGQTKTDSMLLS